MPATLDDVIWPLTTDRLTIRRMTPADVPDLWRFRRLPSVAEWMTTLCEDEAAFRALFEDGERLERTLVVEHDGHVVGDLMVRVFDAWCQTDVADAGRGTQAEIGWALDPAAQGRGLAAEGAHRLLELCFVDLGLRRVTAECFAANEPSWRLMERLGMRREAVYVGNALHRTRGWCDSLTYALLREEWAARRG